MTKKLRLSKFIELDNLNNSIISNKLLEEELDFLKTLKEGVEVANPQVEKYKEYTYSLLSQLQREIARELQYHESPGTPLAESPVIQRLFLALETAQNYFKSINDLSFSTVLLHNIESAKEAIGSAKMFSPVYSEKSLHSDAISAMQDLKNQQPVKIPDNEDTHSAKGSLPVYQPDPTPTKIELDDKYKAEPEKRKSVSPEAANFFRSLSFRK